MKHFPDVVRARKHWTETDPKVMRKATIAEKFDSFVVGGFYDLLILGMLHRCVEKIDNKKVEREVLHQATKWNEELEDQLDCIVIPIRSLVRVQLGSALSTAEYISKNG